MVASILCLMASLQSLSLSSHGFLPVSSMSSSLLVGTPVRSLEPTKALFQKKVRTSLVVQWIGIHCLPMPGTGVQSLVCEDSICHGQLSVYATITKPRPQLLKPTHLEPVLHKKRSHSNGSPCITVKSPCSPQLAKACTQQQRPSATKEKLKTEA